MSIKKVIFDTDPGIDDAMALLYLAMSPDIELLGITTVLGNADVETTTRNAVFLKERFGLVAPIAKGADVPLSGETEEPPYLVHGRNGLGDIPLPDIDEGAIDERNAAQFIVDTVNENPNEVTIIAVGRMTNLALALRLDPSIARLAKQIVIMGGAFGLRGHSGNVTPCAEANIHGDPLAADEVFAAAWPVVVVGLDVTHEALMSRSYLHSISVTGGANGMLIWDATRLYEEFYRNVVGVDGIFAHDSMAVAYVLDPSLFKTSAGPIRVVTEGLAQGQTIQQRARSKSIHPSWQDRPDHLVCTDVNATEVLKRFFRTVTAH